MTDRVTIKELQAIVARINRITGSPETPWVRDDAGNLRTNIGNYAELRGRPLADGPA